MSRRRTTSESRLRWSRGRALLAIPILAGGALLTPLSLPSSSPRAVAGEDPGRVRPESSSLEMPLVPLVDVPAPLVPAAFAGITSDVSTGSWFLGVDVSFSSLTDERRAALATVIRTRRDAVERDLAALSVDARATRAELRARWRVLVGLEADLFSASPDPGSSAWMEGSFLGALVVHEERGAGSSWRVALAPSARERAITREELRDAEGPAFGERGAKTLEGESRFAFVLRVDAVNGEIDAREPRTPVIARAGSVRPEPERASPSPSTASSVAVVPAQGSLGTVPARIARLREELLAMDEDPKIRKVDPGNVVQVANRLLDAIDGEVSTAEANSASAAALREALVDTL